ncbi:MAG: hypothetical protein KF893_05260 [Caldilineaceae bacterium]|nr:hypothetical protein [Caldilineaceae bacterium]
MDYSGLLRRALEIVTRYPFLILMGVLAALSGGIGGGGSTDFNFGRNQQPEFQQPTMPDMGQFQMPEFEQMGPMVGAVAVLLPVFLCFALIIGIVLWVIGTVARGGLVAGVDAIENGGSPTLGDTWRAGWSRVRSLLGISLIPAIPGLILFAAGVGSFITAGGMGAIFGGDVGMPVGVGLLSMLGVLACIALPFALVLGLLRTFAERACMIEGLGTVDSYRRGIEVLMANLGNAVILFVIQIVIGIVIGLLLILPGIVAALCFLFWPLIWLVNGAITAYFSGVWTLAWRQWTVAPGPAVINP